MTSAAVVWGTLRTDGLRFRRDRFLIGMTAYIITISVVMRWALPWAGREVAIRFNFDLTPYYPLLVSHFVVQLAALLGGILGGLLLLEGREDRTVRALLVSPVPLSVYMSILGVVMIVFSVTLTLVEGGIIGLGLPPWHALLGAAIAGAPAAPALAFFIGAVADTKTEAFAYMKICGLAPLLATGAWFVPEPWQWLATVYPPYLASKAYWVGQAGSGAWPFWAIGGLVWSMVWAVGLGHMFSRAARQ